MNTTLPPVPTPDVLAAIAPRPAPTRVVDFAAAGASRADAAPSRGRESTRDAGDESGFAARLAAEMRPESGEKSPAHERRATHAQRRDVARERADEPRAPAAVREDADSEVETAGHGACAPADGESADDTGGDEPPPGGKDLPPWLAAELLHTRPAPVATQPPGMLDVEPVTVSTTGADASVLAPLAESPSSGATTAAATTPIAADAGVAELAAAATADPETVASALAAAEPVLADGAELAPAAPPSTASSTVDGATARVLPETASHVARLLAQARAGERVDAPPADRAPAAPVLPDTAQPRSAIADPRPATVILPNVATNAAPLRRAFTLGATAPEPLATTAAPRTELAAPPPFASPAPLPPAAPPAAAPAQLQIATALDAPEWGQQLGERVNWLVSQDLTNAQLKLTPAHLGPIEIRISVSEDQANVWFGAHSAVTREALEAAAPRLRDMLGAQGYSQVNVNVNVDVSQQAFRDRSQSPARYEPAAARGIDAETAAPAASSAVRTLAPRSRLDAYA